MVETYVSPSDGLCLCGCGRPTGIADRTRPHEGWVKGQSKPFLPFHKPARLPFERWIIDSDTGCWIWQGATADGYGVVHRTNSPSKSGLVHIVNWEAKNGPIPPGMEFDHLCHSAAINCPGGKQCLHRRCVNPDHLEPVTDFENSRRGRRTILTWDQVRQIRALQGKMHFKDVARQFGLEHPTYVHAIWRGKVWRE